MFAPLLKKLFGSKNEREVKRMLKTVQLVNAFEEQMVALSDDQLRAKTDEFKARIAKGETLDKLLPEAFAVAREAGKRIMGMRHFDVQLVGGMTLHEGKIAEMRTGEGKTLVATLGVYLNALSGKGVHVVTVNDYLARRDANWMRPLYEFLGLTVGVVTPFQPPEEKRAAYAADITYGTNNEFGFDYLRDNMAFSMEEKFQRELNFAVIDEVDSILIDEARTPLIISGQAEDSSKLYMEINKLIPQLELHVEEVEGEVTKPGHYTVDEKTRQVELNEAGHQYIEEMLTGVGLLAEGESLYSAHNLGLLTHVYAGLRAHKLFHRNIEYIVQDGQVVLVDEHTGRTMPGRRLSEGLHQAIEAKENLNIQAESQTLASTTFQNYFRLYNKLSGMTGTADTEAFEFAQIYNLNVMVIPPNKPLARKDFNDLVFLTAEEKYAAIINDIKEGMAQGRPILVGTATIETSEHVSSLLNKEGIEHKVLNAKFHEKEAEIIAQAGRPGALTIATNYLQADTVQTFSDDAINALNLFQIVITPLGNAYANPNAANSFILPITSITVGSGLEITGGAASGSALELSRMVNGEKKALTLANFQIDFTASQVLADTTPKGGVTTPKMPLFNFTKLSELAIKYKFPLTITAQETLGTLKLTEEALVAQIQALEVNEFLARAVVPEIDFGTLYEDIKIKFRKAVSTKPYVPAP